ncbi:membrane protein [Sphaerisporangium melleum]|uniref:Membrane protein n=1 Tax=Sphaerisporangium melleum TaxID=321316 RepID=A0A917R1B7_9ACTN|nr:low temperature requirement protein A [Sphaerisporangium melleum]GGK81351.1 membrane protein [Sphaerisporangium melleum]GII73858.1 membrane protein [Sphaerisporangium melleum]
MSARPIDEPHRVSSQLELLFDLTFVIGVAAVTARFGHSIGEGHGLAGLIPFLQVFFAIWWAWMNFTWFASSYDCDDVSYRVLTMLQMAGVLVLAAGVPAAADRGDYGVVTLGYLIMRMALVAQWVRAGVEDPASRRTALRYAAGITLVQVGWVLRYLLAEQGALPAPALLPIFVVLITVEMAVPWWAERAGATTWHPHHIAERYGLFTIILLGESVLAASRGVEGALEAGRVSVSFVVIAFSGLVLLFAIWWLYFLVQAGDGLSDRRHRSYLWGYGHYGIFAALAALGAGLEVAVERTGHDVAASSVACGYAVAIPVGVCVTLIWAVHALVAAEPVIRPAAVVVFLIVIVSLPLAASSIGLAGVVAAIAVACVLLVAVTILARNHGGRRHSGPRQGARTPSPAA